MLMGLPQGPVTLRISYMQEHLMFSRGRLKAPCRGRRRAGAADRVRGTTDGRHARRPTLVIAVFTSSSRVLPRCARCMWAISGRPQPAGDLALDDGVGRASLGVLGRVVAGRQGVLDEGFRDRHLEA